MEEASTEIGSLSMEMSELVGVVVKAARTRLSGGAVWLQDLHVTLP
jgi:hypothetical protein